MELSGKEPQNSPKSQLIEFPLTLPLTVTLFPFFIQYNFPDSLSYSFGEETNFSIKIPPEKVKNKNVQETR